MSTSAKPALSDAELVAQLGVCSQGYLQAVDAWETEFQKYYRLAGSVSADLDALHRDYLAARRQLQDFLPHAHRLCLKYSVRNPWSGILHIRLGSKSPQAGSSSSIGRAERALISQCLNDLEVACRVSEPVVGVEKPARRGIVKRILGYFV